jgi:hypothetical protein
MSKKLVPVTMAAAAFALVAFARPAQASPHDEAPGYTQAFLRERVTQQLQQEGTSLPRHGLALAVARTGDNSWTVRLLDVDTGEVAGERALEDLPVDPDAAIAHVTVVVAQMLRGGTAPPAAPDRQEVGAPGSAPPGPRSAAATPPEPATERPVMRAVEARQAPPPHRNLNLKINPLGMLTGTGGLELEIRIADSMSISPTVTYASAGPDNSIIGGGARATIYMRGPTLTGGFIVSPFGMLAKMTFGGDETTAVILGSLAGYQWIWDNGFNIGLGGGLAYFAVDSSAGSDMAFSGIGPAAEFTLGIAF